MTFSRAETLAPDQGALYPGKSIDCDFINKCFVKPVNQIIKLTSEAVTLIQRHFKWNHSNKSGFYFLDFFSRVSFFSFLFVLVFVYNTINNWDKNYHLNVKVIWRSMNFHLITRLSGHQLPAWQLIGFVLFQQSSETSCRNVWKKCWYELTTADIFFLHSMNVQNVCVQTKQLRLI